MTMTDSNYFVPDETYGSRQDTAVALVGAADEHSISQRAIRAASRGFWVPDELAEKMFADAEGTADDGTADDGTADDGTADDGTTDEGASDASEDGTADDASASDASADNETPEDSPSPEEQTDKAPAKKSRSKK